MYKALKIELKLTVAQKIKVCQTIGTERFIYNERYYNDTTFEHINAYRYSSLIKCSVNKINNVKYKKYLIT